MLQGAVLQERSAVLGQGRPANLDWYRESRALVIGIDKYSGGFQSLRFATRDAEAIRNVLVDSYGFSADSVTVLLDEKATNLAIREELARLSDPAIMQQVDRVLIYYSGHGHTVKMPSGGELSFLVPYGVDVDRDHLSNPAKFIASAIDMREVWRLLAPCPARHVLVIADVCFSGAMATTRSAESAGSDSVIAEWLRRPARQVITAGASDQVSVEIAELGHGVFTSKLLEELKARAISSENVFSARNLHDALSRSVANATSGSQTPQFSSIGTEGEFMFRSAIRDQESGATPGLREFVVEETTPIRESPTRTAKQLATVEAGSLVFAIGSATEGRVLVKTVVAGIEVSGWIWEGLLRSVGPAGTPTNSQDLMIPIAALSWLGTPYKWGGTDLRSGIDSSHFVTQVLRSVGISAPPPPIINQENHGTIVHIKPGSYRREGKTFSYMGPLLPLNVLRPGDRIIIQRAPLDDRYGSRHTGIYIGALVDHSKFGSMQHAVVHASSSRGVTVSDLVNSHLWTDYRFALRD